MATAIDSEGLLGRLIGNYVITDFIAKGAQGEVSLAWMNPYVTLKKEMLEGKKDNFQLIAGIKPDDIPAVKTQKIEDYIARQIQKFLYSEVKEVPRTNDELKSSFSDFEKRVLKNELPEVLQKIGVTQAVRDDVRERKIREHVEGMRGTLDLLFDTKGETRIGYLNELEKDILRGSLPDLLPVIGIGPEHNAEEIARKVHTFLYATERTPHSDAERKNLCQQFEEYIDPQLRLTDDSFKRVIKTLDQKLASDPRQVKRFENETRIMSRLNHKNIIKVWEGGEHEGLHYMVEDYVDSINLDKTTLTVQQSTHITREVLEGLMHAHADGILHRDIKPSNILVSKDHKTVKLTDFGIAKSLEDEEDEDRNDAKLTATGQIIGTPFYLDPEGANNRPRKKESDIYSLGATFYKFLTGKPPAIGTSILGVIMDVASDNTSPWVRKYNPNVSEKLEDIVMMMLAKDINVRLSAEETKDLLDNEKEIEYRELTKSEQDSKHSEIQTLTKTVTASWKKQKSKQPEIKASEKTMTYKSAKQDVSVLYELGQQCEKLAHLHSRDENGVEERKLYFSKALEAYNKFFGRVPVEELDHSQILVKNEMQLLEKRIALEDRRMQRLNQLGKTKKKPNHTKWYIAGATAAVLGIAALVGTIWW